MTELITFRPEYRALMMFDELPPGCISFMSTDEYSVPHIRPGEFVVVDTIDRTPRDGEVYVIQWNGGRRNICQASRRQSRRVNAVSGEQDWYVGGLSNPRGRAAIDAAVQECIAAAREYPGWSEGPFAADGYLESILVGCVIGLYAPRFEEARRSKP